MINLLPHAVVEQLADRIARLLQATLQARLASSVGSGMGGGSSGGGHGGGSSGGGSNRRSGSFGAMFANYFQPNQQASSGDGNRARGSSPANSGPPRSGLFDRVADWYGQRQARQATGNQDQDWWRRGWGNRTGSQGTGSSGDQQPSLMQRIVNRFTGNSGKKSAFARASRLKVIAQRRLSVAKAAVKASNAARGQSGWHPAAHGALLATQRAAQQKVAQATALQARATGLGAAASVRVAAGLGALASKIPVIGIYIAAGAAAFKAGVAVSKIPSKIAEANDSRINSMRPNANFSAQIAGSLAGYDLKSQLRQASMARATAESGSYLLEQQNRLQDALQPIRERLSDVQNNAMGWLAEKAANMVNGGVKAVDETGVQIAAGLSQIEAFFGGRPAATAAEIRAELKEQAEREAKEKMKPQETMFDFAMSAWTTSIEHKKEARQNNKPRPPLRPVK